MAAVTTAVVGGVGVANSIYQGRENRKAANRAARAQLQQTEQARKDVQQAQMRAEERQEPFLQAGQAAAPLLTEFVTDPTAQYEFLQNNPIFQASLNVRDRATLAGAATTGRIGTGDFSQQLQENYLLSALPLLGQREQGLTNLTQIGQAAANLTGASGLQTAQQTGQLGQAGANVEAARIAALRQGAQSTASDVIGGLGALAPVIGGMLTPPPPGTVASDYTGQAYQNWLAGA